MLLEILIFKTDTNWTHLKALFNSAISSQLVEIKISVICKLEMRNSLLQPILKPQILAWSKMELSISTTRVNKKGDKGSHCLIPVEALKSQEGEPFTKAEKEVVQMHSRIQPLHLSKLGIVDVYTPALRSWGEGWEMPKGWVFNYSRFLDCFIS